MIENPSSSLEISNTNGLADGKLFDTYYTIHVQESIGTLFLGILVILLFLELKRSRNQHSSGSIAHWNKFSRTPAREQRSTL